MAYVGNDDFRGQVSGGGQMSFNRRDAGRQPETAAQVVAMIAARKAAQTNAVGEQKRRAAQATKLPSRHTVTIEPRVFLARDAMHPRY